MARPKGYGRKVLKEDFEKLCALQCTEEEIASFFNVSHDTLFRWCVQTYGLKFSEVYPRFSCKGKISLRRNQMRLAETNPTMAIWLGKQYLGQKDYVEQVSNDVVQIIHDVPTLNKEEN